MNRISLEQLSGAAMEAFGDHYQALCLEERWDRLCYDPVWRVSLRNAIAIGLSFLVLGCGIERHAPVDFCKEKNRKISNKERIIDVLVEIAQKEPRFVPYKLHYLSWRHDYLLNNKSENDVHVAEFYYRKFPDCCKVKTPRYLNKKIVSDDEYDAAYGLERQRYVAEVFVSRQLPFGKIKSEKDSIIRAVWPCNDRIGGI